jgi:Mrp family chromosome partitioning ATPase
MWKLNAGLLDADIYGPSILTMMNLHQKPDVSEGIPPFLLYLSMLRLQLVLHRN